MATASCSVHLFPAIKTRAKPRTHVSGFKKKAFCTHYVFLGSSSPKIQSLIAKAAPAPAPEPGSERNKPNSVICADCEGTGAVCCSQCKGDGVNSVDFFDGRFKAGESCWLCGGKKIMLCGNCNGAGFIGGFMSTYDQ